MAFPSCNNPKPGNPIDALNQAKQQVEDDYAVAGASPLRLSRTYYSLGYAQRDPSQPPRPLGNFWRTNYDRTISLHQGSAFPVAYADRPDGSFRWFLNTGGTWQARVDLPERLSQLVDGSGNVTGWRLVTASNEIETYDADGLLLTVQQASGSLQTMRYSNATTLTNVAPRAGLLIQVSDAFGRALGFRYDANGQLTTVIQPDGGTIQYGFDGVSGLPNPSRLVSTTFSDGNGKSYLYNEAANVSSGTLYNALTGIVDENQSRLSTYTYLAIDNRATGTQHAGGIDGHSILYSGVGFINDTDALGSVRRYNYAIINGVRKPTGVSLPGGSGCGASSSNITYDANGNVSSRTDFDNHKTTYTYDLSRNLETQRIEASGTAQARTISTQWHPDWRLEARRAEPKKLTTWVYNGQVDPVGGGTLNCAPSDALLPDGKPIAVLCKKTEQATTDATGASGFSATVTGTARTWTYTYNRYGQVLTAKGPRSDANDTTTYTYYADTNGDHTLGDLESVTDPLGHVTRYTRYDPNGHLLERIDANGLVTSFTYTPRGWLKTRQAGSELTTYDYDAVGQLKKVAASDSSWLGYDYDAAHRLTTIYDNRGDRISYTLDNAGNRTREDVSDPSGNLVRTQSRVYDALSRLQNIIQPE